LFWLSAKTLKEMKRKTKKLVDISYPLIKCAFQVFIFKNLDVETLELGMKAQFANF
jgi:hypothetical protein